MRPPASRSFVLPVFVLLAAPRVLAADPAPHPLPVPVPPGATVVLEVDAHDDDLLGMVKSLLKGINGQALESMLGAGENTQLPGRGPQAEMSVLTKMLSSVNLGEMFQEVRQLHFVVFTPAQGSSPAAMLKFYDDPFTAAGGRCTASLNCPGMMMKLYGFQNPLGMGLVIPGPNITIAARTEGYPNFQGVGPMLMLGFFGLSAYGRPTAIAIDRPQMGPADTTVPSPDIRRSSPSPDRGNANPSPAPEVGPGTATPPHR